MIRSLGAVTLLFWPVQGLAGDWPALFDVQNVDSTDVLNIRETPSTRAPVIGTLAPDATNIEVVGSDPSEDWGLINTAERSGWVSLGFMVRKTDDWTAEPTETSLTDVAGFSVTQCFGTEPFWSLEKQPGDPSVKLLIMGREPRAGTLVTRSESRNIRNRLTVSAVLEPTPEAPQGDVIATFRGQTCSDGMSDRTFGIDVDLYVADPATGEGGTPYMLSGCCSIQPLSR